MPAGYFYGARYGEAADIGVWTCCAARGYDRYCPGGSVAGLGAAPPSCPGNSFPYSPTCTPASLDDCNVFLGTYFFEGTRQNCPVGFWCPGGSITGSGLEKNACPEGQTTAGTNAFMQSSCRPVCDGGLICGATCVTDFESSSLHCGDCDIACDTANYECRSGFCRCKQGFTECNVKGSWQCVDATVNSNCGYCNNVCAPGSTCTKTPDDDDQQTSFECVVQPDSPSPSPSPQPESPSPSLSPSPSPPPESPSPSPPPPTQCPSALYKDLNNDPADGCEALPFAASGVNLVSIVAAPEAPSGALRAEVRVGPGAPNNNAGALLLALDITPDAVTLIAPDNTAMVLASATAYGRFADSAEALQPRGAHTLARYLAVRVMRATEAIATEVAAAAGTEASGRRLHGAELAAVPGRAGRRLLDEAGCDVICDTECNLRCCAEHDRAFAEHECTSDSWKATLCPLGAGVLVAACAILIPIPGAAAACASVVTPACSAMIVSNLGCVAANFEVMACIAMSCAAKIPPPPTNDPKCYNGKCGKEFACSGSKNGCNKCDQGYFKDTNCCDCPEGDCPCSSDADCLSDLQICCSGRCEWQRLYDGTPVRSKCGTDGFCCKPGEICADPTTALCCLPGEVAVQNGRQCCPADQACGQVCCNTGLATKCADASKSLCCAPGDVLTKYMGCCPPERACGDFCCGPDDEFCADPKRGVCCGGKSKGVFACGPGGDLGVGCCEPTDTCSVSTTWGGLCCPPGHVPVEFGFRCCPASKACGESCCDWGCKQNSCQDASKGWCTGACPGS